MCHDGTGWSCDRAATEACGAIDEKPTAAEAAGAAIGVYPGRLYPKKSTALCLHRRPLQRARRRAKPRRSGLKSGSGRWSHWDEIGWVHYPEIGWSHSDEIRGVQSLEILHAILAQLVDTGVEPLHFSSADLQVPEQHCRARSSRNQSALRTHERIQVIRHRCRDARWLRTGSPNPQATVQFQTPRTSLRPQSANRLGNRSGVVNNSSESPRCQQNPRCTRTRKRQPNRKHFGECLFGNPIQFLLGQKRQTARFL